MSMTQAEVTSSGSVKVTSSDYASYGGFVDALGGVATVVLAIIGLSGVYPALMLGIVTIIFGAALLIEGGTMLSEYARIIFPADAVAAPTERFGVSSLSVLFLVGAAGIVLGVLALVGINPSVLTAAAVIAFGAALVLSSNAVMNLHRLKSESELASMRTGTEILAGEVASGASGIQAVSGLTAIVLGIIAVVGHAPGALSLVALLILGATLILTGTTLSYTVMSFMRPLHAMGQGIGPGMGQT
jgi:hypothetical protein